MFLKWSKLRPPSRFSNRIYRKSLGIGLGVLLMAVFSVAPADVRLVNISTRAPIQGGAGDIIAGFIIEGTGTQRVVIRGWDLEPGVDAKLTLRKFPSSELVASNDNWQDDPRSAEIPSHMISHYDKFDAALLLDLAAGAYTVTLSSMGEKGLGLVGIDAIDGTAIKLINISTRAPIQGGAGDVIAGFIIEGTETQRVVIRGWDLEPEVDAKLTIRKFPSSEFVASNDNWQDDSRYAEIPSHMISHYDKFDAALLLDLAAGAYTVTLSSVGAKGIGLVGVDAINGGSNSEEPSDSDICPASQPIFCPKLDNLMPPSDDLIPWLGAGVDSDRNWLKQEKCLAGDITSLGNSKTELSSKLISSFKDVLKIEKMSAGGKVSVKFFKAHAKVKYEKMFRQTSYTQSYVLNYNVDFGSERIGNISISERGKTVSDNVCDFRRYCGDKYVSEVTKGGKVYVEMNFKFKTTQQKKEFSTSGGFGFAGEICCVPFSIDLEASVSRLSQTTRKESSLQVVAHQEGGKVEDLVKIFGSSNNSTSCSLDDLTSCKQAIDDIIEYVQNGFAETLRDYPSVSKYKYSSFDSVIGAPDDLVLDITPEMEQAREDLADEYEQRLVDLEKLGYLLQYSLSDERKQKMTTLLAALENDVESLSEAGVVCFSDLGNCLAEKCKTFNGLTSYNSKELELGFYLNDGLVAYYPFDGNANDESGNNLGGQVHNVKLMENRFGDANHAYEFNGRSSYIQVRDSKLLDFTTEFSIALWVRQYGATIGGYRLVDKEMAGTHNGYLLDTYDNQTGKRMRATSNISNTQTSNTIYSLNEWHHLAISFSDGEYKFYLDGVIDGYGNNGESTIQVNNHDLLIGKPHLGCNGACGREEFFNGVIDDIHIYERALSDSEIKALYNRK